MQNLVSLKQEGRLQQISIHELREMFFAEYDKKYISIDDNITGHSIMVIGDSVINKGESKPAEISWSEFCKALHDSHGFVCVYSDGHDAPRYYKINPQPELKTAGTPFYYFDIK